MRLDNEKPSENVEDRRGQGGAGGGFGFPRGGSGRGINIPMGGGRGGLSLKTIVILVIIYFAIKLIFGIDLLQVINGGGVPMPNSGSNTEITLPSGNTDVADAGSARWGGDDFHRCHGRCGQGFRLRACWVRPSASGTAYSSRWGRPIRNPIWFSSPGSCNRPAAWHNRPWARFIARGTARSISTCPSIRT